MFKRTVCLIIALLVTTHCYAGTIHHSIPDSNYTKYANGINCVVPIKGTFKEENGSTTYFVASCVIIRERWIATAAHVVSFKGMSYEIKVGDEWIKIREVFIHPEFKVDKFGDADIALGFLDKKAKVDFIPKLYRENNEVNKVACIVGYGTTGNASNSSRTSDNKKRAGTNRIIKSYGDALVCNMDRTNPTIYEFCIMPGDSGGGLFIDKKIAGISSCILNVKGSIKGSYGTESYFTRISSPSVIKWLNFILDDK